MVPAPFKGMAFDWLDALTYGTPFTADGNIDRVYLVSPPALHMMPPMKVFIDFAHARGVKRFVLLSSSTLERGGSLTGRCMSISRYLMCNIVCFARRGSSVDNLFIHYGSQIRGQNEIFSTADIADAVSKALTEPTIQRDDLKLVGPELLSYALVWIQDMPDAITEALSEVLGREIKHRNLRTEEYREVLVRRGIPANYAAFLGTVDAAIVEGVEEKAFRKANVVGKRRLRDFANEHRDAEEWRPI
ncbi:hypothetical protein B0H11DRAFT_1938182 [Mycena galericulata]|nr:hypothetical protein B0H11DRAFT_1938182 [Mycena galericulata]